MEKGNMWSAEKLGKNERRGDAKESLHLHRKIEQESM
jgi:hypothetical protein